MSKSKRPRSKVPPPSPPAPPPRKKLARLVFNNPAGGVVVGLVVALVLASLAASGVITVTLAFGLLSVAWLVSVFGFRVVDPLSTLQQKHKVLSTIVLAVIFGAIGWFEWAHQPLLQQAAKNIGLTRGPPLKLADLFKSDFPHYMGLAQDVHFSVGGQSKVTLRASEYDDFTANSLFVGFYLPSSQYTYEICVYLADNIQDFIKKEDSRIRVFTKYPGEPSPNDLHDLKFTGRVYIYEEDRLSVRQIADLTDLYRSKGMFVQFRGPDYAITRWMGQEAKPASQTVVK